MKDVIKCMDCPYGGIWYLKDGRVIKVECNKDGGHANESN